MMNSVFFYLLSVCAVAGALGVVFTRHPMYAVLSLVTTLFALSALFILLHAFFVAMVQILVYAGAILVLFLFVVMLLDMAPENILRVRGSTLRGAGILFGAFFLWELMSIFQGAASPPPESLRTVAPLSGTTRSIGTLLFTTYSLPFELASLLLLVGIIGAVVLAKKKL